MTKAFPATVFTGLSRAIIAGGAFVLLVLGSAPAFLHAEEDSGAHVSAEIHANQRAKLREAARLAVAGKTLPDAEYLEWEPAVLYVTDRLSPNAVAELEAAGILVNPEVWVPPVPGLHPHGFHLARMRYDAVAKAAAHPGVVRIGSAAARSYPANDITRDLTGITNVNSPGGIGAFRGEGVVVAVADSGLDLTHPDIPEPIEAYDVTTGDTSEQWSTDVTNTVTGHGTHVTGTVLGRGTLSAGDYAGMAPEADLLFYKIGNSEDASTTEEDMVKAVMRAAGQGAHVFNLSYGGFGPFMDGTAPTSQAMDAAHFTGMNVVVAAGNSAAASRHYSQELPPGATQEPVRLTVATSSAEPLLEEVVLRLIWRDDDPGDGNVTLELLNQAAGEEFYLEFHEASIRGTEMAVYILEPNLFPGNSKTFDFRISNTAAGGDTPRVHLYQATTNRATLQSADASYTVTRPADTTSAIAAAAYVHRRSWVDYTGTTRTSAQTEGQRASFSSIGPRVDGFQKPDILAPGSYTISTMDGDRPATASNRISNDGINDGSGPANYSASQGTSMAAPTVAGALALLRGANPALTAEEARTLLLQTASKGGEPDFLVGHGLLNVEAALDAAVESLAAESWLLY